MGSDGIACLPMCLREQKRETIPNRVLASQHPVWNGLALKTLQYENLVTIGFTTFARNQIGRNGLLKFDTLGLTSNGS